MHPEEGKSKNGNFISLELLLEENDCIELTVLCSFYVLNVDGKKKHKKVMSIQTFNKTDYICACHKFLECTSFFDKSNKLLSNGDLTVGCEIFYCYGSINTIGLSTNNNINESLNVLLDDIAGMLKSPKFSDCVIKVRDSEIKVHKNILASRSKVFDSILMNGQCESNSNIIEINGFSLKAVGEMINYLYTGNSPNMDDMAYEMLGIGQKYKLQQLKLMAEESMVYNLSTENACDYLRFSEEYSGKILKKWCLGFIYLNAEDIIDTNDWKELLSKYPLSVAKIFNIALNID